MGWPAEPGQARNAGVDRAVGARWDSTFTCYITLVGFLEFDSVAEAHEWIGRQFGSWPTRPTPEHLEALRDYKGVGFGSINAQLRSGQVTRFTEPEFLAITEAIAAEPLTETVMVYRGIDDPEVAELVLTYAEEIPHEGFVSVSLVRHVAEGFLDQATSADDEDDATNVLLIGALRIGTHAAPLDFIPGAANSGEAELLLHAGSTFVIESFDDSDLDLIEVRGYWREP